MMYTQSQQLVFNNYWLLAIILIATTWSIPNYAQHMQQPEFITVKSGGLVELEYKVSNRPDAKKSDHAKQVVRYETENGRAAYYFTMQGHPAHPSAMFKGWVKRDNGADGFDLRAWTASDDVEKFTDWANKLAKSGMMTP